MEIYAVIVLTSNGVKDTSNGVKDTSNGDGNDGNEQTGCVLY